MREEQKRDPLLPTARATQLPWWHTAVSRGRSFHLREPLEASQILSEATSLCSLRVDAASRLEPTSKIVCCGSYSCFLKPQPCYSAPNLFQVRFCAALAVSTGAWWRVVTVLGSQHGQGQEALLEPRGQVSQGAAQEGVPCSDMCVLDPSTDSQGLPCAAGKSEKQEEPRECAARGVAKEGAASD